MDGLKDRISVVFKESGLTQAEFGEKIRLSQTTVSKVIAGTQRVSTRTMKDIADKFQVNEDWLRTGEGPMRIQTTRQEELSQFFGQLLHDDIPDRREIITALSRMPQEWWKATADLILSAADAIKKNENPEPE